MGRRDDERFIREALEAEELAAAYYRELQERRVRTSAEAEKIENSGAAPEALEAERYTRKWHAVYDWAFEVLEWDSPADWYDSNPRVTRVRAAIVADAENEEEAFRNAIPVELIDDWLATVTPPGRDLGGHRRVIIRLYTWQIDREHKAAYDPEWLKIGDDMSAHAATARALRWAHTYAEALANETASREIRMTQIEIVWWTSTDTETLV